MKRLTKISLAVAIAGMVLFIQRKFTFCDNGDCSKSEQSTTVRQKNQPEMHRRTPHPTDGQQFLRISPQKALDQFRFCRRFLSWIVVVNNTDPNLTNTDTFNDGETSITANPANPNEVVITAFSGSWGANAPLWQSTDGGNIWTKQFTIPAPPGIAAGGCPCDQADRLRK